MSDLLAFQRAAVDRIVERLSDEAGTRRFLLADEVGLGKTIIARSVIERLHRQSNGDFVAIYVCSNQEIARQNASKLVPKGASQGTTARLTLMCRDLFRKKRKGGLELFCFTPGTSLNLRSSTGLKVERRLLLHLLDRMGRTEGSQHRQWEEFFRCGCTVNWTELASAKRLATDFQYTQMPGTFVDRLERTWSKQVLPPVPRRSAPYDGALLLEALTDAVEGFDGRARQARRSRNRIISALRTGLAMATLGELDADVIVLDEFQRFEKVLKLADNPDEIVGRLMGANDSDIRTPVLILSATPYKMLSLSFEDGAENHHDKFLETLSFLYRCELKSDQIQSIRDRFRSFGRELRAPQAWEDQPGRELMETRDALQHELAKVASRTERNWYLEDVAKGVQEVGGNSSDGYGAIPTVKELRAFARLRRFLIDNEIDDWKIVDFWKSVPAPLLFMDTGYALMRRIRGTHKKSASRVPVPKKLVPSVKNSQEVARLARHNARFRTFLPRVFGDTTSQKRQTRFLWTRPTYTYHRDTFFKSEDPHKFLVFSHWRMVPKAISIVASQHAIDRLGGRLPSSRVQPLNHESIGPLAVLWASPFLAELIDPIARIRNRKRPLGARALRDWAFQRLKRHIEKDWAKPQQRALHIRIGGRRQGLRTLIPALLRLDASTKHADTVRNAIESIRSHKNTSRALMSLLAEAHDLLDDNSTLVLTEDDVRELADIALASPAVCTLRASWTVLDKRSATIQPALEFGLTTLQQFFNRPIAQQIVRNHTSDGTRLRPKARRTYARDILKYCLDAHFQAMMDEYVWLAAGTSQLRNATGQHGLFPHLTRAMGMWTGRPQLNRVGRAGYLEKGGPRLATQYALAFGDEVAPTEDGDLQGGQRSAVRDAFNSPFWPFVLATTSVGQEGLDFHLYCRDIVHWNLPANPVDLEQREGRINRFNGLFVRRNIAADYELHDALKELNGSPARRKGNNVWDAVFRAVEARPTGLQRFKHGLYPHWIYRPGAKAGAANESEAPPLIRRHLLYYAMSSDEVQYARLKRLLATYRLAFGQPRQQDLLEDIMQVNPSLDLPTLARRMRRYMVNLSPMDDRQISRWVGEHAKQILDQDRVAPFIEEVRSVQHRHSAELSSVSEALDGLVNLASDLASARESRLRALYALVYLANPYDNAYDFLEGIGMDDDRHELLTAWNELRDVPGDIP